MRRSLSIDKTNKNSFDDCLPIWIDMQVDGSSSARTSLSDFKYLRDDSGEGLGCVDRGRTKAPVGLVVVFEPTQYFRHFFRIFAELVVVSAFNSAFDGRFVH